MATIQIRGVPDSTHDRLKALAAERRLSLNQLLLSEVGRIVPAVSAGDWVAEVRRHAPAGRPERGRAARLVREARDERAAQVLRTGSPRAR